MLVRCTLIADGPGPSEAIIGIRTREGGEEEVVLSKRQVHAGLVDIGAPILIEGDNVLIELPRETVSGRWRIWVDRSQTAEAAAAAE